MKKLFIFILVVLAVVGIFYASRNNSVTNSGGRQVTEDDTVRPKPSNATFIFNDGSITLTNGREETVRNNLVEETTLLDDRAYGDLNNDGKEDVAVLIMRSGGTSGIFVYAAAYVSGPVGYKGTNALFLGDRISPQSISVSKGVVTARYLDRDPDEPFAAEPTVPVSKQFVYRSGKLEER